VNVFDRRRPLVLGFHFPRWVLVEASVLAMTVSFLGESLAYLVLRAAFADVTALAVASFLLGAFLLVLLVSGASLLLAGLNAHLRDVGRIWTIVLRVAFFAAPVFYPLDVLGREARIAVELNPVTQVLHLMRSGLGGGTPAIDATHVATAFAMAFALNAAGALVLRRMEPSIAEVL
jgi:ABC-type polysaccharide/polyol phosphate export permease